MVKMPAVQVDLRPYYKGEERGHAAKSLVVLHETVSHNRPGVSDIRGVASFMDSSQLEIHGIVDMEGNSGWCYDPTAVYDHAASGAGGVNTRSVGFELVSEIPLLARLADRTAEWKKRRVQLDTVAAWCAFMHKSLGVPLRFSDSTMPGITSHWNVSRAYLGGRGHWDCHPRHMGGHFPIMYVIYKARQLAAA